MARSIPNASTPKRADGEFAIPPLPSPRTTSRLAPAPPSSKGKEAVAAPVERQLTRLLWRGTLVAADGTQLHGIALVAHVGVHVDETGTARPSFIRQVSSSSTSTLQRSALRPITAPQPPSSFDDPFSPFSAGKQNLATCLDLELCKSEPLKIISVVTLSEAPVASSHGIRAVKDRIRDRLMRPNAPAPPSIVELEQDADVRAYIDPRCPATHAYLEQQFCADKVDEATRRTRTGVALALSDAQDVSTQFILFGERVDPSKDTARASELSEIRLLIGRRKPPRKVVPRPDDPMPRENVFAQNLRRSASQPSLVKSFALPGRQNARPTLATVPSTARNPLGVAPTGSKRKSSATPGRRGEKRARQGPWPRERTQRSPSEVPTVAYGGSPTPSMAGATGGALDENAWETKNKNTIRKLLSQLIPLMGVARESEDFTDIFNTTRKGVGFAMRDTMRVAALDPQRLRAVAVAHLTLYIAYVS